MDYSDNLHYFSDRHDQDYSRLLGTPIRPLSPSLSQISGSPNISNVPYSSGSGSGFLVAKPSVYNVSTIGGSNWPVSPLSPHQQSHQPIGSVGQFNPSSAGSSVLSAGSPSVPVSPSLSGPSRYAKDLMHVQQWMHSLDTDECCSALHSLICTFPYPHLLNDILAVHVSQSTHFNEFSSSTVVTSPSTAAVGVIGERSQSVTPSLEDQQLFHRRQQQLNQVQSHQHPSQLQYHQHQAANYPTPPQLGQKMIHAPRPRNNVTSFVNASPAETYGTYDHHHNNHQMEFDDRHYAHIQELQSGARTMSPRRRQPAGPSSPGVSASGMNREFGGCTPSPPPSTTTPLSQRSSPSCSPTLSHSQLKFQHPSQHSQYYQQPSPHQGHHRQFAGNQQTQIRRNMMMHHQPQHSVLMHQQQQQSDKGKIPSPEDLDVSLLEDIPALLKSLRLHKYTPVFRSWKWQDLVELDDDGLKAKGVDASGARSKFLKLFEVIKERMGIAVTAGRHDINAKDVEQKIDG